MTTNTTATLPPNPHLLIALGGLGTLIGLPTHNAAREAGYQHHRTIVIDTDKPVVTFDEVGEDFQAAGKIDDEDERLQIVRLTGQNLKDWRQQNTRVLEGRFPTDLPTSVHAGARKQRIVGGAAALANAPVIRSAIESSMDQLRQEGSLDQGVMVVNIVTGSSGGSGSSSSLLVAMMVHDVFHKNYDAGHVRLEIRIVVVLPDCYNVTTDLGPQMKRNATWMLREINAAQTGGRTLKVPLSGGNSYDLSVPPGFLHKIVPISGRGTDGNIGTDRALRAVSQFLLVDLHPTLGRAIMSEEVDILPRLEDYSRHIMGFAAHELTFADTSTTTALLLRRKIALAFAGLPAVERSETVALADKLVPITFSAFVNGSTLPERNPAHVIEAWVQERAGTVNFQSLARALSTMASGFTTQDETGRTAHALGGSHVNALVEELLSLSYTGITVPRPAANLDSGEIQSEGNRATNLVTDEVDRLAGEYRRALETFFSGQGSDAHAVVESFLRMREGSDFTDLSTMLRAAFARAKQTVTAENPDLRGRFSRIASDMVEAQADEAKAGTAVGIRPVWLGGKAHQPPPKSSASYASDLVTQAHAYAKDTFDRALAQAWNAYIDRVASAAGDAVSSQVGSSLNSARSVARSWNAYINRVQVDTRAVVSTLEGIDRLIRDEASATVADPIAPPTVGFRSVVTTTAAILETLLPTINTREQVTHTDFLSTPEALLEMKMDVSVGKLFSSNAIVRREIARILRAGAFLTYNPSRCGGTPNTRIFMSGPAELLQHPVVREKMSANELRYEVVVGSTVDIVVCVYGVKLGAISGVESWEQELVGARNDLAVSDLTFLKLPSLVEYDESLAVAPFLLSLVIGLEVPTPVADDPWSYCSSDALLRRVGKDAKAKWVFQPYPGDGRAPVELGKDLGAAWTAFRGNHKDVRAMAIDREGDLLSHMEGWSPILTQVEGFATALLAYVDRRNTALVEQGEADGVAESRERARQLTELDTLRDLYTRTHTWVSDKRRVLST